MRTFVDHRDPDAPQFRGEQKRFDLPSLGNSVPRSPLHMRVFSNCSPNSTPRIPRPKFRYDGHLGWSPREPHRAPSNRDDSGSSRIAQLPKQIQGPLETHQDSREACGGSCIVAPNDEQSLSMDEEIDLRRSSWFDVVKQLKPSLPEKHFEKPALMHLRRVTNAIAGDAKFNESNTQRVKQASDAITTQIANMRQTMRGDLLSKLPLLSLEVLTKEEQLSLVGKLRPWNYDEGDTIIDEGDFGDRLFVIIGGVCQVWKNLDGVDTKIVNLYKGSYFGEIAVMYDMPYSASVVAGTDCTVLSLCRADIFSTLDTSKIQKMKVLARTQIFASIPIFAFLSSIWKVRIAESLHAEQWHDGTVICREGVKVSGVSQRIYIIERGACASTRVSEQAHKLERTGGRRKTMRQKSVFLSPETMCYAGSFTGILELIYACPWQNTLTARGAVTTLSISKGELCSLLGDDVEEIMRQMKVATRVSLLQQMHPSFKPLKAKLLETLLDAATLQHYDKWQTVFRKGEALDRICMLEEGVCVESDVDLDELLSNSDQAAANCVEHDQPGDSFGTRHLIAKYFADQNGAYFNASFTLVAVSKCTLLWIPMKGLSHLPKPKRTSMVLNKELRSSVNKLIKQDEAAVMGLSEE